LSRDIKTEYGEREETATSIRGSADKAVAIYDVRISSSGTKNWRAHCYETDISRTLDSGGENPDSNHGGLAIVCKDRTSAIVLENHPSDSRIKYSKDNVVQTLSSRMGTGGGNVPLIMEKPFVIYKQEDIPQGVDVYNGTLTGDIAASLTAACGGSNTSGAKVLDNGCIVRRLTPLECERLQGFEDGWTDIGDWVDTNGRTHKGTSDAPRYKALGNSIALPFWRWMAERMVKYITNHQPTMASLFDGICGFPVVFSEVGCKPIWASEVEPFCIEVAKIRFPE
jgi:site-specific DNA-cytosine methylase